MKKITFRTLSYFLLFFISFSAFSQKKNTKSNKEIPLSEYNQRSLELTGYIKCLTDENEALLQEKYPNRATKEEFEAWLAPKIQKTKRDINNRENGQRVVRTIPIIFHVFTDGLGAENLDELTIQAQVDQLNIDYADLAGSTYAVSADTEIQFCLAQVNESGIQLDEPGINRVTSYGDGPFTRNDFDTSMKAATQWDPTKYFNVWVADLSGGILGYAQFPDNSGLDGLNVDGGPANTDGVVVLYSSVGSIANPNPNGGQYNAGRTLTHEAGHWLGLRHIWGDGGCNVDDYCDDTPLAGDANYGCPNVDSCVFGNTDPDMVENYMDYTDDSCMHTFTVDQSTRIAAVMDNCPRRMELASSNVCTPAMVYDLDSRATIESLNMDKCEFTITPVVRVYNNGNNTLTSATINYDIDGGTNNTISWTGNLVNYGDFDMVNLPEIALGSGDYTFNVSTSNPNGASDMNPANDADAEVVELGNSYFGSTSITLTLLTDDYGYETSWDFVDSNGTVLYNGGNHPTLGGTNLEDNTTYTEIFTISDNECYTFTIYDDFEDGICCDYGNGSYELMDNNSTTIFTGGEFDATETTTISTTTLSTNDIEFVSGLALYPNPTSNVLNIKTTNSNLPDNYAIYNMLGQVISKKVISSENDLTINTANLSNGMYFIKISKGANEATLRFMKK
ncbi:M43 family zinc metalloprotease [Mangrovimonas cancribranchiae]|uniref:M43 family zinc metalloprotease n=1 Tax=Mangrovimonas cancribranchiae TaxID=3080055 RepID=A0AAU6NXU4_9FLAO